MDRPQLPDPETPRPGQAIRFVDPLNGEVRYVHSAEAAEYGPPVGFVFWDDMTSEKWRDALQASFDVHVRETSELRNEQVRLQECFRAMRKGDGPRTVRVEVETRKNGVVCYVTDPMGGCASEAVLAARIAGALDGVVRKLDAT